MFGLILSLAYGSVHSSVPKPGVHPEWGPEPPVAPYSMANLPSERVRLPLLFPVLAKCRWFDDYNVDRGKFRHTGIDIRGPKMSPIIAPIPGIIGFKKDSFWIYGDSGWAVLGTHLNDDNFGKHDHAADRDLMFAPDLVPGQYVHSGQFIGYLGESGDATAPHLHFEIYAPGSGTTMTRIRDPFPSLKTSQVISKPVVYPRPLRPRNGYLKYVGCVRRIESQNQRITLILTAIVMPTGETISVDHVRYLRVALAPASVARAHGWNALGRLSSTASLSVTLPESDKPDDETAVGIEMPHA